MEEKMSIIPSTGSTKVQLGSLIKNGSEKIPTKFRAVLKGHLNVIDHKKRKLKKKLSMNYYHAMKLSFNGTKGLINKWMIWRQSPIGGHYRFQTAGNKRKNRIKEFLTLIWKTYKISHDSIYILDEFDRLRAMDFQLNKIIQMGELSIFYKQILKGFW